MDARYWDRDFETRPWAWTEAWQAQQLAAMLDSLPERSEYYRGLLAGAGRQVGLRGYWISRGRLPSLDMLENLPFTTKEDLRRAQDDAPPGRPLGLQQAVPQEYVVQVVSSSGTTGRPVFFGLTRRDLEIWTDVAASVFWTAGIRPDDVVAHLAGVPLVAGGLPYADGLRCLGAAVAWLGGHTLEQVLAWLAVLQVTAVLTTTPFACYLAEPATRARLGSDVRIRKVLASGEPGTGHEEIRRRIGEGWGTTHVRETMGLADVMAAMWSECDMAAGMHFNAAKYVIVELVEPETGARVPWTEGARGEAVYTTFDRDATPVLRYRSADHLEVTGVRCPCGRTSPRVRCAGRTEDMLVYRGRSVFPSAIRDVVLRRFRSAVEPHLRIWRQRPDQARFDDPIPLEVEVVDGLAREGWGALADRIAEAVWVELQVRVAAVPVPPGTLPRSPQQTALVQVLPAVEPGSAPRRPESDGAAMAT